MRCNVWILVMILFSTCLAAQAGVITGKVTGAQGASVVYVDTIPGKTFPAPVKPFVIDQKGLLFQPHIVTVLVGSTVEFLNSDTVAHNVFWPAVSGDKKQGHNLGTWPKGEKRAFKFDRPGVVPLLCNVHPEMSGFVVVVPTPYYTETDAAGNYKIADVPDGSYTLSAWHEGMKVQSKPVTVSGDTKADFALAK